jgi:hypothetical protein
MLYRGMGNVTEASIEIFGADPRKSQVYMLKSNYVTLK